MPQVAVKNFAKMTKDEKVYQYAVKLNAAIASVFDEDSENHIPMSELEEGENAKIFIHALATVAPNRIFNKLTGDNKNNLEFNHICNILIFEYCKGE